jgi:hypothetical protein
MSIDISSEWKVAPAKDQISSELGQEAVVLQCSRGIYYGLNPVAATIWRNLPQVPSTLQLSEIIVREFEVTAERCATDLLRVLQEMADAGLVEIRHV